MYTVECQTTDSDFESISSSRVSSQCVCPELIVAAETASFPFHIHQHAHAHAVARDQGHASFHLHALRTDSASDTIKGIISEHKSPTTNDRPSFSRGFIVDTKVIINLGSASARKVAFVNSVLFAIIWQSCRVTLELRVAVRRCMHRWTPRTQRFRIRVSQTLVLNFLSMSCFHSFNVVRLSLEIFSLTVENRCCLVFYSLVWPGSWEPRHLRKISKC